VLKNKMIAPANPGLFDRILMLAQDLHAEGRSEFAHRVKTCPHRDEIFAMHDSHRKALGKQPVGTLAPLASTHWLSKKAK
jgi:hypothetical protein